MLPTDGRVIYLHIGGGCKPRIAVRAVLVSSLGLEPRTHALKVHCSTN
jgi:hypothetical protein